MYGSQFHLRLWTRISIILLALITAGLLQAAPPDDKGNPPSHQLGRDKIAVVPDAFLRGFDPITVFYPTPVGPAAGGPLDRPGNLLKISPEHPGEYRFLDGRTLQFRPAIAWPALGSYTLSVQGQSFRLITLMAPPTQINPSSGSDGLDPIRDIDLFFSQPLENDQLASMVTFEVKPLPGLGERGAYRLTSKDFTVKVFERKALNQPVHYRITFGRPVGFGSHLAMNLRLAADSRFPGSLQQYTFATRPYFKLTGIGSGGALYPVASKGSIYPQDQSLLCQGGSSPLYLEFSDQPAPLSMGDIKRLVRFEPAVRDFAYELSGNRILLSFTAAPNKAYRLRFQYLPIRNNSGDVLAPLGETSLYFHLRPLQPYIRWQASQGILERYGPQMLPVEGRGLQKLDVRITKVNPLDRRFWPFPDEPVFVDESTRPASPGEEPGLVAQEPPSEEENEGEEAVEGEEEQQGEEETGARTQGRRPVYGSAYASNMAEQIKLVGSPLVSKIMPLPLKDDGRSRRFGLDLKAELLRISGEGAPGTYLVGYRPIGEDSLRHYVRVQVTDLDLTVVEEEAAATFLVTSLQTGLPKSGAEVWVEGEKDGKWQKVISGTTDASGRFHYLHKAPGIPYAICRVGVKLGEDVLILDPHSAPPEFANNHWFPSQNVWFGWLNSWPRHEREKPVRLGHILTERPIYRPEEAVHIKGYLRIREKGRILPDTGNRASLVITAPGDKNWTFPIKPNAMGSFYQKFEAENLPSGDYLAELQDEKEHRTLASVTFKMESYRIPSFEVQLTAPDETGLDEPFKVTLAANYYAGGRVVGQEVEWKVTQFLYTPRLPSYPGFIFSSDERFAGSRSSSASGSSTKKDVTDENGSALLKVDPTTEEDGRSRRYAIEATVRGADEMTVTASKQVLALPPFFLGLKMPRLAKSPADFKAEALVLGVNRKPEAGRAFRVRVFRREWHSYLQESDFTTGKAKYSSDVVDKLLLEKEMKSDGRPQTLNLGLKDSGVYVVEISSRDRMGRLIRVSQDFFLAGEKAVTWKKPTANVFETFTDRDKYLPGQTARIVLRSPFQTGRALVVVEGPAANDYRWLDVQGGQALFELPITPDMTPRIPVHFLLMRGRIQTRTDLLENGGEDRGKPLAMGNTTWLVVMPQANEMKVELQHPAQCLPGSKITMKIALQDPEGKPLDGEVALWLVDRAVLSLGKEKTLDPLGSFISQVDSILRIRNSRNQTVGNITTDEIPGGDVGKPESESIFEQVTVRRTFKSVPYYNPAIMVKGGAAEVAIEMPDNLTDFAVRAVATNGRERFGSAKSVVSVRLPLVVEPALPRFVRPGDSFSAGGIGRVVEGPGGPGRAELQVEGLNTQEARTRSLQWAKDRPERLYFSLSLPADQEYDRAAQVTVRLAVARDADGAKDAFELKLPVRADNARRRVECFVPILRDKPAPFPTPDEPARPGSVRQRAVITHEPGLLKMLAALDYLSEYPHGCTEQRISKILPELVLKEVFARIGREDRGKAMDHFIRETLAYLETVLTPAGLYSYWPGSPGYVSLTAYVAEFLVQAQKAGYPFKKELLDRAIAALRESLRSDYSHFIDGCSYIERAEALNALGVAGYFDKSYALDLQARAVNMDLYSEARILHTLLAHDRQNRRAIDSLSGDLWKSIVFKLRDGKEVYDGLQYRADSFSGLILPSEVKTLASVARTLYLLDPKNSKVKLLYDELIGRGEGDGWGSTNANASALMALSQVLGQADVRHPGQRITAQFAEKAEVIDTQGQLLSQVSHLSPKPGQLLYKDGDGQDLPVAWLTVDYLPATPGSRVKQKNNGFVVERELLTVLEGNQPPVQRKAAAGAVLEYEMGAVVEEHIRVINPENRHYVAICAPFAAGFEPLNPNLETAPKEAKPAGTLTLQPSYAAYADDQVTFYFDTLPKGTFDFYFRLRASFEGSFSHPPARAEMMYKLKVFGLSEGTGVRIHPRPDSK